MLSNNFKKAILLFMIIVIFFMLLELTLILIDYEPRNELIHVAVGILGNSLQMSDDKIIAYEFKRNFTNIDNPDLSTNSFGMRDYNYSLKKPDNTYRILVVGDSVAFGHAVALEDSYPKQLETLLNKDGNFEVLNAGVPGYSIIQKSRYFVKNGKELDTDLLLVGFTLGNDFARMNNEILVFEDKHVVEFYNANVKYFAKPKINELLVKKSYVFRLLNNELVRVLGLMDEAKELPLGTSEFIHALEEIKRVSTEENIDVVLVMIPTLDDDELLQERAFLKKVLDTVEISYLDLTDVFRQYDGNDLRVHPDDIEHPNEQGYNIIANQIYNYLRNNNYVTS